MLLSWTPTPLTRKPAAARWSASQHAAHYKQVGGIGVLALGSDFDGIDGHHQLETAADMPLLADALRRAGFTEDEVERIFWRNARDFFEHNL